jgi:hypothetical protein
LSAVRRIVWTCVAAIVLLIAAPSAGADASSLPATAPPVEPDAPVDTAAGATTDTAPLDESQGGDPATATSVTESTVAVLVGPDTGGPVPVPEAAPSAPLLQIPNGCAAPPVASVVFVGTLVAKVPAIARYRVEQVRAGSANDNIVGNFVDIGYDDETKYLTENDRYLVGAVTSGAGGTLVSKVRESEPLFGGNAVIGLTEKSASCPAVEDPVRTLHIDGTEVEASMLSGFTSDKRGIALAFAKPLGAAFGIVLALVAIRWLFTLIFVAAGRAAHHEPGRGSRRSHRQRLS